MNEKKAKMMRRLAVDRDVFLQGRKSPEYVITPKGQILHKQNSSEYMIKVVKRILRIKL